MSTGPKDKGRPNLWRQLAERTAGDNQQGITKQVQLILCSPFEETIKQFLDTYLPKTSSPTGKTELSSASTAESPNDLCFLSYNWFEVQGITHPEDKYKVDTWSIVSTEASKTLPMVSPLLKHQAKDTRLCFLLDWSIQTHVRWLEYILSHMEQFRKMGIELQRGDLAILCVNADQIFELQRVTTSWHPFHIDFIQQVLRSIALFNDGSLIYVDSSEEDRDKYGDLLNRIVSKDFDAEQVEMVKSSKLYIPFGTDTIGFIKTVDDSFDPSAVQLSDFVTSQYERIVPKLDMSTYGSNESAALGRLLMNKWGDSERQTGEDAYQARLAALYEMNRKVAADRIHSQNRFSK